MNKVISTPISLIQKQFWLLYQMRPEGSAYNIPSVFVIRGKLNIDALENSINEIIKRHEIFRTSFKNIGHEILQSISDSYVLALKVEHCKKKFESLCNDEITFNIKNEISTPFDLSKLPLLRVKAIKFSDDVWLLIITMHHIITDLRTKDLFSEHLEILYNAYDNKESTRKISGVLKSYSDYSNWQMEWLKSKDCLNMLSFWEKHLEGHNGILELPIKKNRPPVLSQNGDVALLDFDNQLTSDLKCFSRKNNVTIYLSLLSAFFVLLHRYSTNKDITIGVPLTNRRNYDFQHTMGPFVNIIPLRITLTEEMNFSELMQHVRFSMLNAHRNQEVPYISILNQVKHKIDASYNPIFQAGFTFDHPMKLSLNDLSVESIYAHNGGAQLDLFAIFWQFDNRIHGVFEYNKELFDTIIVNRLVESYFQIINSIIKQSDISISQLPVMPEKEINKVIVEWNSTEINYRDNDCIHTLFERQVEKNPDSVAAIFENDRLTYGELNKKANQLSSFLYEQGIVPGDYVGIYMNRSLDMLVSLMGILKAGAAYVPIDPHFPIERIKYMIVHSKVTAIISEDSLKDTLNGLAVNLIITSSDWNTFEEKNAVSREMSFSSDNLAYIIYTSGSTGRPKGVQVHHGAVVNFLNSMAISPGICEKDVLLAVTTLSFDIAVLELFLPLIAGATTVIVSKEVSIDGSRLLDVINKENITIIQATPVTFRLLILAGWNERKNLKILCGGENLPAELASKLVDRSNEVWNMYGPTETTVWSTCSRVEINSEPVSIGKPIANTKVFILDKYMKSVPIGVEGALFIGGSGVSKGYLHQPELTKEKFVNNPFSSQEHDVLYNTGDIAKFRNDGCIELIGRSDFQLKFNGYRIEANEIETALESHGALLQAKVIIYKYDDTDSRLVAYYTAVNNALISPVDLRDLLSKLLPEYMIPSMFIRVDMMPLTPNGKVDRNQLPKPVLKRSEIEQDYEAPRNRIENDLCDIWCDVLKIDKVGINDRFFEIGGTSLLSVQVTDQIYKKLNVSLKIVSFYQNPTIRSLAVYIESGAETRIEKEKTMNRARLRKESLGRNKGREIF